MSRKNGKNGQVVFCPACDEQIYFRKLPKRGNHITCRECESLLTVVQVSPIQLIWAFEDPLGNGRHSFLNYRGDANVGYDDYDDYEYFDEDYTYPKDD
jgi:hypothetical protein